MRLATSLVNTVRSIKTNLEVTQEGGGSIGRPLAAGGPGLLLSLGALSGGGEGSPCHPDPCAWLPSPPLLPPQQLPGRGRGAGAQCCRRLCQVRMQHPWRQWQCPWHHLWPPSTPYPKSPCTCSVLPSGPTSCSYQSCHGLCQCLAMVLGIVTAGTSHGSQSRSMKCKLCSHLMPLHSCTHCRRQQNAAQH